MRKLSCLVVASFLLFGCTAGNQSLERFDLVMYADGAYVPLMKELVKEAMTNKKYGFEYSVDIRIFGEGSSLDDGHVYLCPSSQLPYLNLEYGLQEVSSDLCGGLDEKAINHFKLDGKLYGIPLSSRVGAYLIYDKSVLGAEDITTYESLYRKKGESGFNFDNPFLDPAYFLSSLATFGYSLNIKSAMEGGTIKVTVEHNFDDPSLVGKLKDYSRLFALDENPSPSGHAYMAYPYGLWFVDYAKQNFGDSLAIAPLPKYGETEFTPILEDLGLCVFNMASRTYAMPLVNDLLTALSSEKAQKRYVSDLGLTLTPTNLKARADYPLDESLYTKDLENAVSSRGYPTQVLDLTLSLVYTIIEDGGKCDEQALQAALDHFCLSLDKLVISGN